MRLVKLNRWDSFREIKESSSPNRSRRFLRQAKRELSSTQQVESKPQRRKLWTHSMIDRIDSLLKTCSICLLKRKWTNIKTKWSKLAKWIRWARWTKWTITKTKWIQDVERKCQIDQLQSIRPKTTFSQQWQTLWATSNSMEKTQDLALDLLWDTSQAPRTKKGHQLSRSKNSKSKPSVKRNMERKERLSMRVRKAIPNPSLEIGHPSMSMLERRVCLCLRVCRDHRIQEHLRIDLSRSNRISRIRKDIIANILIFLTWWKNTLQTSLRITNPSKT